MKKNKINEIEQLKKINDIIFVDFNFLEKELLKRATFIYNGSFETGTEPFYFKITSTVILEKTILKLIEIYKTDYYQEIKNERFIQEIILSRLIKLIIIFNFLMIEISKINSKKEKDRFSKKQFYKFVFKNNIFEEIKISFLDFNKQYAILYPFIQIKEFKINNQRIKKVVFNGKD